MGSRGNKLFTFFLSVSSWDDPPDIAVAGLEPALSGLCGLFGMVGVLDTLKMLFTW